MLRLRPDPMKFLFLRILLPLLLFLIVRSVVKTLFASGRSDLRHAPDGPPPMPASGELKKDPVCGTYVSASASLQQRVGRETVYFCSEDCKQRFRA